MFRQLKPDDIPRNLPTIPATSPQKLGASTSSKTKSFQLLSLLQFTYWIEVSDHLNRVYLKDTKYKHKITAMHSSASYKGKKRKVGMFPEAWRHRSSVGSEWMNEVLRAGTLWRKSFAKSLPYLVILFPYINNWCIWITIGLLIWRWLCLWANFGWKVNVFKIT